MMNQMLIAWFERLPGPIQYRLLSLMWRLKGLTQDDIDVFRDREGL